mmetsp:Transcript_17634/g.36088  ORF Transcript_17634/g.36088 Transcript_17634/m.36088 type:complete len:256 (+) Transcript_17634:1292-2059(+)
MDPHPRLPHRPLPPLPRLPRLLLHPDGTANRPRQIRGLHPPGPRRRLGLRTGPSRLSRPLFQSPRRRKSKGDLLSPRRGRDARLSPLLLPRRRSPQRLREALLPSGIRAAPSPFGGDTNPGHAVEFESLPRKVSRRLSHFVELHRGVARSGHRNDERRGHRPGGGRGFEKGLVETRREGAEGVGGESVADGHSAVRVGTFGNHDGVGGDGEDGGGVVDLRELQERRGFPGLCDVWVRAGQSGEGVFGDANESVSE